MKRFGLLKKRCTGKHTQALLQNQFRHNTYSYPFSYRWLACGVIVLSTHSYSRRRGRHQVCAAAAPSVPPPIAAQHKIKPRTESKIWKCLKKLVQLSKDILRILRRAFYLGLCFTPSVASSPLLLLGSPDISRRWWEALRRSIWAAGPCLTKFSQWAATRPDIFPQYLCIQLAELQSNTQAHTWSATERVLTNAFGPRWRHLFWQLDTEASVGSGLVAQVYHGILAGAGSEKGGEEEVEVAVKVLHPDVKRALEDDLAMMSLLVQWLETLLTWAEGGAALLGHKQDEQAQEGVGLATVFSLSESVEEFRDLMTDQLDLQREGKALTRFRQNFSGRKWAGRVIFPRPIDVHKVEDAVVDEKNDNCRSNWSSSDPASDVLVETFQRGIPMTEVLQRKGVSESSLLLPSSSRKEEQRQKEEKQYSWAALTKQEEKQVAALGMDVILKMIFEDNFIHGDLHPGNLLLVRRPEEESGAGEHPFQLVLLDAGIYTELCPADRQNFLSLFKAVIEDDGVGAARMMIEKSRDIELPNGQKTKLRPVRQEEFEVKMGALVHKARRGGLRMGGVGKGGGEDMDMGGVSGLLREVLRLCYEHRVKLDSHFVSVVLGVAVIEGLGRHLDPDVDLLARAAPFIAKAAAKALIFPSTSS